MLIACGAAAGADASAPAPPPGRAILDKAGCAKGLLVLVGAPDPTLAVNLAASGEATVYVQAATAKVVGEIVAPKELVDGPVWKWMSLGGGVLHALIGGAEVQAPLARSQMEGTGHWPWGIAVDARGRVVVSLEDGQVVCFAAARGG
jgi:hypothetical protein